MGRSLVFSVEGSRLDTPARPPARRNQGNFLFNAMKLRVVLPAAAACLLLVGACAIALAAWAWARDVRLAEQQVAARVAAVRATFVAAGRSLDERARAAVALLDDQAASRGGIERGAQLTLAGKTVYDLAIGGRSQAGSGDFVDPIARLGGGDVVLLSRDGPRFVRITASRHDPEAARALGSELDAASKAYAAVSHGQSWFGVEATAAGVRYVGYEPLRTHGGDVVGAASIAIRADPPVIGAAMEGARLLDSGFVALVDDATVQYLPSWVDHKSAQALLQSKDGSWVIQRAPLPEWDLTIVSAFPAAELQQAGRPVGLAIAGAGMAAALGIAAVLFVLLDRGVLWMLGADPRAATGLMKRIADGDLALDGEENHARPGSLMDSLRMMQLKLKNLVSAVRGGAAELSTQAQRFEQAVGEFERSRDPEAATELARQARAVGGTLNILEKTVARFRA